MKVRIKKDCLIEGVPAHPGAMVDVSEARAKALTDNDYAEPAETAGKKSEEAARRS